MPKRREGPALNKQTGYYFFDERVGIGKDKKRIRFSLKTQDPLKAQWRWEQHYRKVWSEYYGIESPMRPERISFHELANEFIDYERNIKRIKEWKMITYRFKFVHETWGNIDIRDISKKHFIKLDERLKKEGRSENTVNHYFSLLKTFFNYAIKQKKYKGENPIKDITPYVIDQKRREYSMEEIERILKAAGRVEKEARDYAIFQKYAKRIILLLLYTGMRLGEVLNLKWDNIQDDKIILKRTETKQRKEKVIPLTDTIKNILEQFQDKGRKNGYVIPLRRRSGQTRAGWANSVIRKIRDYSGIKDFIFHNIRHTASTLMVSEALGKGVGLADIMKVLGHSQVETTMKYLHPDFDRMKKAMEALEDKVKK